MSFLNNWNKLLSTEVKIFIIFSIQSRKPSLLQNYHNEKHAFMSCNTIFHLMTDNQLPPKQIMFKNQDGKPVLLFDPNGSKQWFDVWMLPFSICRMYVLLFQAIANKTEERITILSLVSNRCGYHCWCHHSVSDPGSLDTISISLSR